MGEYEKARESRQEIKSTLRKQDLHDIEYQQAIQDAISAHCDLDDKKHTEIMNLVVKKFDELSLQIDGMSPTVQDIKDFGTFWKVGRRVGISMALTITTVGVIVGGVYAIKNWVRR